MGALPRRRAGAESATPDHGGAVGNAGLLDALAPMLDANKDGSIADDVMGMLGKSMGGR